MTVTERIATIFVEAIGEYDGDSETPCDVAVGHALGRLLGRIASCLADGEIYSVEDPRAWIREIVARIPEVDRVNVLSAADMQISMDGAP